MKVYIYMYSSKYINMGTYALCVNQMSQSYTGRAKKLFFSSVKYMNIGEKKAIWFLVDLKLS